MVDKTPTDPLSRLGGVVIDLAEAVSRRPRGAPLPRTSTDPMSSAFPGGPRGRRMLSPDTSLDSLDRYAPRGTYLDILV